jgi:quinol monooxygenase YgiN
VKARMWEARAVPGRLDDLLAAVQAAWPDVAGTDGFAAGEIYRSGGPEPRLVMVTRWRDWAVVPDLRTDPGLHARPPQVWDFAVV